MESFANANNCLDGLPSKIREYVEEKIQLCQPTNFHVCSGSDEENQQLLDAMEQAGVIRKLKKYNNWYELFSFFYRIDFLTLVFFQLYRFDRSTRCCSCRITNSNLHKKHE